MISKLLQKSSRFFIRFFTALGSILEPPGHPKIVYFLCFSSSWRQERLQSAPRQLQRLIFQDFGTILGPFLHLFGSLWEPLGTLWEPLGHFGEPLARLFGLWIQVGAFYSP